MSPRSVAASSATGASRSSTSRRAISPRRASPETSSPSSTASSTTFGSSGATGSAGARGARHGGHGGHPARVRGARARLRTRSRRDVRDRALGPARERLVLARDRVGKKPLHYVTLPDGSSRSRPSSRRCSRSRDAPRARPRGARRLPRPPVRPGRQTGVGGIRRLPPGHVLVWEGGAIETQRTGSSTRAAGAPTKSGSSTCATTVPRAVRRRLVSDVPLGALLSGGIDSTIVVGLMAQASSQPVRTFTVGVSDPATTSVDRADRGERVRDEPRGARRRARPGRPRLAAADVPRRAPRRRGDPADLPHLRGCARHVTVALTGDGGDESFAGYERYAAMRLAGATRRDPARTALGARALRLSRRVGACPDRRPFRLARLLETAALPAHERYGALMEVFPAALRASCTRRACRRRSVRRPRAPALLGRPPAAGVAGSSCSMRAPTSRTTCS